MNRNSSLDRIVRHGICAIAFTIRWAITLLAFAVWLACVGVGGIAVYVWITTYGVIPMLVAMALTVVALGLLGAIVCFGIWLVDWAESNNCRI